MNPTLLKRALTAVQKVITGDKVSSNGEPIAPYRTGPQLVEFFNELGFNDSYSWGGGFPTRSVFADGRLEQLNGQPGIVTAIENAMNPAEFIDSDFKPEAAAEYLNKYLAFDGWEVVSSRCHRQTRASLSTGWCSSSTTTASRRHTCDPD